MIKKVYVNGKYISRRTLPKGQSMETDIDWLEHRDQEISVIENCIGFVNIDSDTVVWVYEQD